MITVPIVRSWHICTPPLFRYLPSEFVERFFSDGSLRLSSFERFSRHSDEQRLDPHEGETLFIHRTLEKGGQTLSAKAFHGRHAYVLCGTMIHSDQLMQAFACDSYIRIDNPTQFGAAVAAQIPGFVAGAEGPCLYQQNKIIERNLGYLDVAQFGDPRSNAGRDRRERFLNEQMGHYPFFLKHKTFSHQVEYRLVWFTPSRVDDFIDIKAPEAIAACARPNVLTQ